jgi:DNA-binding NarL/FixJ family response regulator
MERDKHVLEIPASQLKPANITEAMERIELLMPGFAHLRSRNLQEYALAYVERYHSDVLRLEHEWDFLSIALFEAWQRENFEVVVRLTAALAYPASRRGNLDEARRILQLGIAASRKLQNRERLASFLSRLGSLLFIHGKYQQGWRLWHTALHFSDSLAGLWEPLSSFVPIADILGNYPAVQQFVETIHAKHGDHFYGLATAFFIRGFYARWRYDTERAWTDLSNSLQLILSHTPDMPHSPPHQLFSLAIQTELARAQGHYTRAQTYAETALLLAQTYSDHYTVATLLIDQGHFAERQGQFADMYTAYQRLHKIVQQMHVPHILECSRIFEQRLKEQNDPLLESPSLPMHSQVPAAQRSSLTERETEVLNLIAAGLSNQQIAVRLVVTTGTVKKHLEHIYTRLDVHTRTSAVAQARMLGIIH